MSLTGGKRKVNKSLKAWVTFVKKVQKEEKLSYKDAIHRAKQRKDKGEKWMFGGVGTSSSSSPEEKTITEYPEETIVIDEETSYEGGRRTRRRGRGRGRSARRGRSMRMSGGARKTRRH